MSRSAQVAGGAWCCLAVAVATRAFIEGHWIAGLFFALSALMSLAGDKNPSSELPSGSPAHLTMIGFPAVIGAIILAPPGAVDNGALAVGTTFVFVAIAAFAIGRSSVHFAASASSESSAGGGETEQPERSFAAARQEVWTAKPNTTVPQTKRSTRKVASTTVLTDDHDLGPPFAQGRAGELLHFEYADAHGELTERKLANWIEYEFYIRGTCLKRHAVRTFRRDRIMTWLDGEERLKI